MTYLLVQAPRASDLARCRTPSRTSFTTNSLQVEHLCANLSILQLETELRASQSRLGYDTWENKPAS